MSSEIFPFVENFNWIFLAIGSHHRFKKWLFSRFILECLSLRPTLMRAYASSIKLDLVQFKADYDHTIDRLISNFKSQVKTFKSKFVFWDIEKWSIHWVYIHMIWTLNSVSYHYRDCIWCNDISQNQMYVLSSVRVMHFLAIESHANTAVTRRTWELFSFCCCSFSFGVCFFINSKWFNWLKSFFSW